jgi:hypothetical protein
MSRSKRIFANLGLALFGVLLALALGEVALRVSGFAGPDLYNYDYWRGWGLRAGAAGWQRSEGDAFVAVNRYGFRGPAVTPAKPPGVYRIAVLGDSFTEAQQVNYDQSFCAVMQRRLGKCPAMKGRKVQVLDFGVDGYGTAQEYLTLKHYVWKFSPDAVVLAIFTGNDIRNNSVTLEGDKCRPFYVYRGGKLVLGGPFDDSAMFRLNCMARFESRRSAVLDLVGSLHGYIMDLRRRLHPKPIPRHTVRTERGLDYTIYSAPADRTWHNAWAVTEAEIELIHQSVVRHEAQFFAVTLANPMQDLPEPAIRARYMRQLGVSNLFYPDLRIKALGQRDDFPVLNLAPPMQKYADSHHAFLHGFPNTKPGEGHWNAEGHRVAGRLIAAWMCQYLADRQPRGGAPAADSAKPAR